MRRRVVGEAGRRRDRRVRIGDRAGALALVLILSGGVTVSLTAGAVALYVDVHPTPVELEP